MTPAEGETTQNKNVPQEISFLVGYPCERTPEAQH